MSTTKQIKITSIGNLPRYIYMKYKFSANFERKFCGVSSNYDIVCNAIWGCTPMMQTVSIVQVNPIHWSANSSLLRKRKIKALLFIIVACQSAKPRSLTVV